MDKNVKVSVIIPCYNEENFLSRCLKTIVDQTLQEIEIILVDDGSSDNTPNICDEYFNKYPNKIRVIHKENEGQGYARNSGLEIARGEYIGFVDADDWIDITMYEKLYNKAKVANADIVFCDVKKIIIEEGDESVEVSMPRADDLVDIGYYLKDGLNNAYSWNRIYRKEIWNSFRFKRMVYEDLELIPAIQSYCTRVSYIQEPLCTYLKRKGSTTTTFNNIRLLDMIIAYRNVVYNCNPKFVNEISYNIAVRLLRYLITPGLEVYKAEFIEVINELMPYFENNNYILADNKISQILKHKENKTLPNTICYANFGLMNSISNTSNWRKYTKKANIVELNEDFCNIDFSPDFIRNAYSKGQFDFVGEYFKIQYLFYNGGIAIDKNYVLNKPLGQIRAHNTFFVKNIEGKIDLHIYGIEKGSQIASKLMFMIHTNSKSNKKMEDIFFECIGADKNLLMSIT